MTARPTKQAVIGEKPRVLIVDDERSVLTSLVRLLRNDDYRLLTADSPAQAIAIMRSNEVAVVLSDQMMPGMTGVQLAQRLLQIRPELPIILCTGFSNLVSKEKAKAIGIREFALKPLTKREIAGLIRKVLDGEGAVI